MSWYAVLLAAVPWPRSSVVMLQQILKGVSAAAAAAAAAAVGSAAAH